MPQEKIEKLCRQAWTEDSKVPEHLQEYLRPVPMPRNIAGEILTRVAELADSGNYPQELPPYLLGQAVCRVVHNYQTQPGENNHKEILQDFLNGFLDLPRKVMG